MSADEASGSQARRYDHAYRVPRGPLVMPPGRCDCKFIAMGSYDNQAAVLTPQQRLAGIDACIIPTVLALWSRGIETIESCCGHGKAHGYILVSPKDVAAMAALGFEHDQTSACPNEAFVWPRKPERRVDMPNATDVLKVAHEALVNSGNCPPEIIAQIASMTICHTLQRLYDSEINFRISTFWDGGFDCKLGDEINGYRAVGCADTFDQAVAWLHAAAIHHFPNSDFARSAANAVSA